MMKPKQNHILFENQFNIICFIFFCCFCCCCFCIYFYPIIYHHKFALLGAGCQLFAITLAINEIQETRSSIYNHIEKQTNMFIDKLGNIESKITTNSKMDFVITGTPEAEIKDLRQKYDDLKEADDKLKQLLKDNITVLETNITETKTKLETELEKFTKIIQPTYRAYIINIFFILGVMFSFFDLS